MLIAMKCVVFVLSWFYWCMSTAGCRCLQ